MKTQDLTNTKSILITTVFCMLILVLTGFKSLDNTNNKKEPKTHTVTIFQMKFDPEHLDVKKGDKVIWINKDLVPHDVTQEPDKKWTSGVLQKDKKWSMIINEDEAYFCSIHKVMKGTITVIK